jgi:hypothetical protein
MAGNKALVRGTGNMVLKVSNTTYTTKGQGTLRIDKEQKGYFLEV